MEAVHSYSIKPRIFISGETGGTGASTVAGELSKVLQIPRISGGRYYRGIAHDYAAYKKEHHGMDEAGMYLSFWNRYCDLYETQGITGIDTLTKKYWELPNDEVVLRELNAAIKANAQLDGELDGIYDRYVNEKVLAAALQEPGAVVEQKLTREIDELKAVIQKHNNLATPYLSAVLTASPEVAAARVTQRESHHIVTPGEILDRQKRDWARYSELYHVDGKPVKPYHLFQFADEVVSTNDLSAKEVAEQIIRYYLLKIRFLSVTEQWMARDIIATLAHGLEQLKLTHANLGRDSRLASSAGR